MPKSQAQHIVESTFEDSFDEERFRYFIRNLLNHVEEENKHPYSGQYIATAFQPYISTLKRIGKYSDGDNEIDVLVVQLKKAKSLERARTAQRNFIAHYLNGSRGGKLKDAALVAFVSPDAADWRFSLVKMEYKFTEDKSGKTKVKEEFTPAKRWSFLVGKNERSHTAQSRLVHIIDDDRTDPTLQQLEDAFNIEKVTKEFFEKYREVYLRVYETLGDAIKRHPDIRADFEEKKVNTVDFSKKLLGQIVFLYFLQKKGWFGVPMGKTWGEGDKRFLRTLFEGSDSRNMNYFNDYLEPLFYEALAKERDDDFYSRFECKIPFLNGGLFDPISNYDWVNTIIDLPNDLFSNSRKTKEGDLGDGILDIFDRYNFTVKEDEPLEKEVAVDPEMLGKVFENLLEVKDRKSKGTYYTPREIVHYMCEQSLANYLASELEGKVSKENIDILIRIGENVVEHETVHVAKRDNNPGYTGLYAKALPAIIEKFANEIDNKLATIKVCDPAIGSGAFPVGMMNTIVKVRMVLSSYLKDAGRSLYDFKRDCIQNSLYGVDIDPGAVEIAKLRLWLSLVVDEDDIKQIKPLPNLDYKIMQGNSLLEEYEGIKLFDERLISGTDTSQEKSLELLKQRQAILQREYIELHLHEKLTPTKQVDLKGELLKLSSQIKKLNRPTESNMPVGLFDVFSAAKEKSNELKRLHKVFFESTRKSEKDKIKKEIERLEWELIETTLKEENKMSALKKLEEFKRSNTKPFFLWKLNFAEVFEEKGGFDVVIANPPYVSHDKIENKKAIQSEYVSYSPFADLYCYFIELGIKIQGENGLVCYITSNSYLKADYGSALRSLIKEDDNVLQIINIEDFQLFDSAIINTAILISQSKKDALKKKCSVVNKAFLGDKSFQEFVDVNKYEYSQDSLDNDGWLLLNKEHLDLKNKIESKGDTLLNLNTKIRLGLATGANEVFVIDEEQKNKLIELDPQNKEIIKPILRGRDIVSYGYNFNNIYIILAKNGIDVRSEYPEIYKYLNSFGKKFRNRGAQGQHWTNLRACEFFDDFKKEKIIWIELTDRSRFAISEKEIYLLNSAYFLLPPANIPAKYLLGILNSKVINFYLHVIAETSGMGTARWINNYVKRLPIPYGDKSAEQALITLVDQAIECVAKNTIGEVEYRTKLKKLEQTMDKLVYKIYGLSSGDIEVIENGA